MPSLRDSAVSALCGLLALPFRRPHAPLPQAPGRVLVLKPCCLGDVLLATAVTGQLRRRYPGARIDFAVGPWSRAAIENNPDVDSLVDCGPVGSGRRFGWKDYAALRRRLRDGRYAVAFVLDRSPLVAVLPFLAGIPHRVGIDSAGRGFSLTVKAPWTTTKHEGELYLDTLRASGWEPAEPRTLFRPSAKDRTWARERLAEAGRATGVTSVLVAIHPGGGANPGMTLAAKRWFPDRFAAVGKRLAERGHTVVLVGAPSDVPAAERVREALDEAISGLTRLIDLTGQTSFGQLGAVLELCRLFVGNDSSPAHLAVAVGTPAVTIFGPTSPLLYGPFGSLGAAVYRPPACSPCFVKGRLRTGCPDHRCLAAVGVDDVWREVERLLATGGEEKDAFSSCSTPLPA